MTIENIDAATLRKWQEADKAVIVDVREPTEYEAEHIEGAALVPLGRLRRAALPEHSGRKLVVMLILVLVFRFDRDFRRVLCAAGLGRGRKQGEASGERRFRLLNLSPLRARGRLVLEAHDIGARRFKFYGYGLVFDGDVQPAMSMHMKRLLRSCSPRPGSSAIIAISMKSRSKARS